MQELLDSAFNDVKLHRRDAALIKILNAMAMMSQGVAHAMHAAEEIKAIIEAQKQDGK